MSANPGLPRLQKREPSAEPNRCQNQTFFSVQPVSENSVTLLAPPPITRQMGYRIGDEAHKKSMFAGRNQQQEGPVWLAVEIQSASRLCKDAASR